MPGVAEPGRFGRIGELAVAVVDEELIAAADAGYEQVRVAVVVSVRERGADADLVS